MSRIGRNGTFTANLRFRFFLQNPIQKLFKNHYRKFQIKIHMKTHLFQEFLDPTKKEGATSIHFIPSLALPRYLERTAACIRKYTKFAHRQPQQLSKLGVTTHYNKLSTSSFRLFVLERSVMLIAFRWAASTPRKPSIQDRMKGNFECIFLKIFFAVNVPFLPILLTFVQVHTVRRI